VDTPRRVTFFETPIEFRTWLAKHHASHTDLWIGFFKKHTAHPSITWPEAVDEALCFGWIDGVRKRIDEVSYCIRFTPRKARSTWSEVNIARIGELTRQGRMRPAGIDAFARRTAARSGIYAYEQKARVDFDAPSKRTFRGNAQAWKFFQSQPQSYRRTATWWVVSAKRETTRQRRLAALIDASAHEREVGPLTRRPGAN
jgi:uncharacterized protein YdeI (YjbR/CyaY-like superfamily)